MEKPKNNNCQNTNNTDKQKISWDRVPLWEKLGWRFKYCWTCGSGFHEVKTYKPKKEGHKDEADYTKRMGRFKRRFKICNY